MSINLPQDTNRLSIVGATGSGKTVAALWHLSKRSYTEKPWIIYDYKYDEHINGIEGAQHINIKDPIPERPGIYLVHPHPAQDAEVTAHMWKIWERENIGVYVDEGYMIGNQNPAYRAILTQGRSKHIPLINLSQRPTWIDRFILSESEFHQVFRLQHEDDLKIVQKFIPVKMTERLPEFYSYYYDVGANKMSILAPVPDLEIILRSFEIRLRGLKKVV
jgi:hypothetical protein